MAFDSQFPQEVDVVVMGGGPAGATVSALIAQEGYRVALFERERFPRFHIGESLIPETYWVLRRLGMLDKLRHSHFVKKYSAQFVNQRGELSEPFNFVDHKAHESSQTWQVLRSEFDQMMLDNAREKNAQVYEGTRVLEVLFEGSQAVGVRVQGEDGREREVRAKVVVDALGQSSLLLDRLNLREWDPVLKKAAIWTYWKGAFRDTGLNAGATAVIQTEGKKGWFWYIPLHEDKVSVGVVASYDYLFEGRRSKKLEDVYFEEVARCPGLQPRIANAQRCDVFRAQKEYTYRGKKAAGDGWTLVGDAYGFLDPLYSSGVLLALHSGAVAAGAIVEGLKKNDVSETQLRQWEPDYNAGMDRMRRLVVAYYEGFSFGHFVRRYPHLKGYVTDVLFGDVFKAEIDVLWPLIDEMRAEQAACQTSKAEA